jgi:ribonuclease P protein component
MATKRFTLAKSKRLTGRKNMETLFRIGEAFFVHPYRVVLLPGQSHKVAFAVSKRIFKHAVDRNRVKRLTREAYRLQQEHCAHLPPLHIMFQYVAKQILSYDEVYRGMEKVINKLNERYKLTNNE